MFPADMCTHDRKFPQDETFLALSCNQRKQRTLLNSVTVITLWLR